ncbi:hypothetical protein ACFXAH_24740 [Agrobacterium deltaense]
MNPSTATPSPGVQLDPVGRQYVTDTRTGTVVVLMDEAYGNAYVRPIHGGPEWRVEPGRLRPATAEEVEAAR